MDIRKPKTIKQTAGALLQRAPQLDRIMLIYCGIVLIQCLVVTGLNYLVDHQLNQFGGLGNLGKRTLFSTFAMVLPILHALALLVLDVGLLNAMLRVSRGQYSSAHSLKMGLSRFWGVFGCTLLRIMLCVCVGMLALNTAIVLFLMTPLSGASMALLEPMVASATDPNVVVNELMSNQELTMAYLRTTIPLYIIFALIALFLLVPMIYRLRCAEYILIDNPRFGGFRSCMDSYRITRRRWMPLLKLDLSFWWYYLLCALVGVLSYMDIVAPALGIPLPWPSETAGLIFYGLYLIAQISVYYFFRPRLEVSKALIYNELRPKEEENKGVVLGNIFQM